MCFFFGSIVNGVTQPALNSLDFDRLPGWDMSKKPRIELYKEICSKKILVYRENDKKTESISLLKP